MVVFECMYVKNTTETIYNNVQNNNHEPTPRLGYTLKIHNVESSVKLIMRINTWISFTGSGERTEELWFTRRHQKVKETKDVL